MSESQLLLVCTASDYVGSDSTEYGSPRLYLKLETVFILSSNILGERLDTEFISIFIASACSWKLLCLCVFYA